MWSDLLPGLGRPVTASLPQEEEGAPGPGPKGRRRVADTGRDKGGPGTGHAKAQRQERVQRI